MINSNAVFTVAGWVRRDDFNYYPSARSIFRSGSLQPSARKRFPESNPHKRRLRSSISYVKGVNNIKAGISYEQTLLNEHDHLGIVDPTYNAPCLATNTNPLTNAFYPLAPAPGFTNPSQCAAAGDEPNTLANLDPNVPGNPANGFLSSSLYPLYSSTLAPYDLTRGGSLFTFNGHTDVKELAMYVQDTINKGNWSFNLGIRGDLYNGLTRAQQAEPRVGISYNVKPSNTILRVSYARTLETPFNENIRLGRR